MMTTIDQNEQQKRLKIQKRVLDLERYNNNQHEFSDSAMVAKIKKIIEEENK